MLSLRRRNPLIFFFLSNPPPAPAASRSRAAIRRKRGSAKDGDAPQPTSQRPGPDDGHHHYRGTFSCCHTITPTIKIVVQINRERRPGCLHRTRGQKSPSSPLPLLPCQQGSTFSFSTTATMKLLVLLLLLLLKMMMPCCVWRLSLSAITTDLRL